MKPTGRPRVVREGFISRDGRPGEQESAIVVIRDEAGTVWVWDRDAQDWFDQSSLLDRYMAEWPDSDDDSVLRAVSHIWSSLASVSRVPPFMIERPHSRPSNDEDGED